MKIYFDVCCLNRPFDTSMQERINYEAEAVLSIIGRCRKGIWSFASSSVIEYELSRHRDNEKRLRVLDLYSLAAEKLTVIEAVNYRAKEFQNAGIKIMDSLHLAIAEYYKYDILLTTDDILIKAAKRVAANIRVENPLNWYTEVLNNES